MTKTQIWITILGFAYWIACTIIMIWDNSPRDARFKRDWQDWDMILTAPFWVTLYFLILSYQFIEGKMSK